jgi:hypothetical protein
MLRIIINNSKLSCRLGVDSQCKCRVLVRVDSVLVCIHPRNVHDGK